MDERLRRRIFMFYFAGAVNLLLGFYVLFQGGAFLDMGKVIALSLFFFAFAAVDFYFPYAMKKRWREEQAKAMQGRQGGTP
jgi:uncharacterized membrane protein